MNSRSYSRIGILVLLGLVMAATRSHHFSPLANATWGPLPDASWAVFFVAGYYLRDRLRWAFPLLMALAVVVDYFVISATGVNFWTHYCVSASYWFLLPAYFVLWMGGAWLATTGAGQHWRDLGKLAAGLLVAVSVSYIISNGSYYWLSDTWLATSADGRSFTGWMGNLADWYLPYLRITALYVGVATVLHVGALKAFGSLHGAADRSLPNK